MPQMHYFSFYYTNKSVNLAHNVGKNKELKPILDTICEFVDESNYDYNSDFDSISQNILLLEDKINILLNKIRKWRENKQIL
jgi:hypothetical protein